MWKDRNNFPPRQDLRPHHGLALFFAVGATMCTLTITLLFFPGTALDSLWRLNPEARTAFQAIGSWSIAIMLVVGTACGFTAIGLWRGAFWGSQMAIVILLVNAIGDLSNVVLRRDYRALIGLPIAAAMIFWLIRPSRNRG